MVVDDGKERTLRDVDDASPPDATRVVDRIAVCRYNCRKCLLKVLTFGTKQREFDCPMSALERRRARLVDGHRDGVGL